MKQTSKTWYDLKSKLAKLIPHRSSSRLYAAGGGVFIVIMGIFAIVSGGSSHNDIKQAGTFAVRQGDLTVSVTESGSIKAGNAVDIKSEVEGQITITYVVPEGTYIKPEDVNNKVLVELDSSGIKERLTGQEITFESSKSSYTEANETYRIQQNQNDSDISKSRLKLHFALIDLQKYLGEEIASKLLVMGKNNADPNCDIAALVNEPNLGGEALQKLRESQSAIDLASAQLKQSQSILSWTQKLYEKKYVAGEDLEKDRLTEKSNAIALDKAKTAADLLRRYEFPKQTRQLLSDYIEAGHELERTQAQSRSKLAQAEAKLLSAEATYKLQEDKLDKLRKQLAACVVKAPAPGLVVYEDTSKRWSAPIEVGASIGERQTIMSLPNTAEMSVEIKVHENSVDKVRPGLPARITVDSLPDQAFTGRVTKVAPLPDQRNSWMNPDLKVYLAEVSIDGKHEALRQGKSAKVEIIIDQLTDVTYVPVQAVCNQGGKKVCYLAGDKPQSVPVSVGSFNDDFVEITDGLSIGQLVLLNPPTAARSENDTDKDAPKQDNQNKPVEAKKMAKRGAKAEPAGK